MDNGQWTMGEWTMDNGRWTAAPRLGDAKFGGMPVNDYESRNC